MTPEQSLQMLYGLARKINMPADDHDKCKAARDAIANAIPSAEAQSKETEDAT